MYNLMLDPIISIRESNGAIGQYNLPQILSKLMWDTVMSFLRLRPYQRHSWHALLVQLSVIGMQKSGMSEVPVEADQWRLLLQNLTNEFPNDEPWQLVVDDVSNPAFMQAPVVGNYSDYKHLVETPDNLDLLVTSKNHDVKQDIAIVNRPEDWLFAILNLQTMGPYFGRGNYGIARMNRGYSSRPCLGLAPYEGHLGAHVKHDIDNMLRNSSSKTRSNYDEYDIDGTALLWLKPWDGRTSLSIRDLHPDFIEICRVVRLIRSETGIKARRGNTKVRRIQAKALSGNTGDYWTPVEINDQKALSISQGGFTYQLLTQLLLSRKATWQLPLAMKVPSGTDGQWKLVARAIARGKGKTEGYYERNDIVISPPTAKGFMSRGEERETLANICAAQLEEIKEVANALGFAIALVASGGKDRGELAKDDRAASIPYKKKLDEFADSIFFHYLDKRFLAWQGKDSEQSGRLRLRFVRELIFRAEELLDLAIDSVLYPAVRKFRARAKGKSGFHGMLRSERRLFSDQPEIFHRGGDNEH